MHCVGLFSNAIFLRDLFSQKNKNKPLQILKREIKFLTEEENINNTNVISSQSNIGFRKIIQCDFRTFFVRLCNDLLGWLHANSFDMIRILLA